MAPRLLIGLLAACATPAPHPVVVVNHQVPARVPFDLGMAFAPAHHTGVLAAHALPSSPLLDTIAPDPYAPTHEMCAQANAMTGDGAAVGCDEEPADPRVYDLDGDGVADLALISHRSYLGGGDRVYIRAGATLVRAIDLDATLADERADAGGIALRFEETFHDVRMSFTLRYDAIEHRWDTPVVTLHAALADIPVAHAPYREIAAPALASLFLTPDGVDIITLARTAHGIVVATRGTWSFVALRPETKLRSYNLALPLDLEGAWICGWISTAEIR